MKGIKPTKGSKSEELTNSMTSNRNNFSLFNDQSSVPLLFFWILFNDSSCCSNILVLMQLVASNAVMYVHGLTLPIKPRVTFSNCLYRSLHKVDDWLTHVAEVQCLYIVEWFYWRKTAFSGLIWLPGTKKPFKREEDWVQLHCWSSTKLFMKERQCKTTSSVYVHLTANLTEPRYFRIMWNKFQVAMLFNIYIDFVSMHREDTLIYNIFNSHVLILAYDHIYLI